MSHHTAANQELVSQEGSYLSQSPKGEMDVNRILSFMEVIKKNIWKYSVV